MFKNYLKIAFRRFWRQKSFTIINVLGLSTGLAIAIVMLVIVKYQLSFDNFHANGKNIYQLGLEYTLNDNSFKSYTCAAIWGEAVQNNYPEIIQKTRLGQSGELLFNIFNENGEAEKKYIEDNGAGVDSTFFQMFSFPLQLGSLNNVLKEPYSIVLSKEFAKKYFGDQNPIGETITINSKYDFKITGVLKELPQNTSFKYDYYFPISFLENLGYDLNSYQGNPFQTYLLFEEGSTLNNIKSTLKDFLYSRFERDVEYVPLLISVEEMYMFGDSMNYVFMSIFAAIAIFILIMACINFMNLSTATSLQRSKEVAIRKIVGAYRKQLIKQFLSESILLAFISLNIAIVLSELIFDILHKFTGEVVPFYLGDYNLWIQLIILALFTGIMAGSYPALFLSSFQPVKILSFHNSKGGGKLRKILVVFQFILSIIFLTITIWSYRQYQAVRECKEGIDIQEVLSVPINGEIVDNYDLIKNDLLQNPNILSVSTSGQDPTWVTTGEFEWGISPDKNPDLTRVLWVNYDYLDVFNIKLKQGRFFSQDFPSDMENAIIINERIVEELNIDDPIGSQFYLYNKPYTIIGVIEYFNFFPIEVGGSYLIMKLRQAVSGNVYIRYNKDTYPYLADYIKQTFEKYNTSYPYKYSFYSDFQSPIEEAMGSLNQSLIFFTSFGIFIAILGLLGLSAFMVEQKTKEIGIRKALGASVNKIVLIITRQFFKLILIANVIALPISYLIYSYASKFLTVKANGDVLMFIMVIIFIFLISFFIIYAVTIKAAKANPARSLRYE